MGTDDGIEGSLNKTGHKLEDAVRENGKVDALNEASHRARMEGCSLHGDRETQKIPMTEWKGCDTK